MSLTCAAEARQHPSTLQNCSRLSWIRTGWSNVSQVYAALCWTGCSGYQFGKGGCACEHARPASPPTQALAARPKDHVGRRSDTTRGSEEQWRVKSRAGIAMCLTGTESHEGWIDGDRHSGRASRHFCPRHYADAGTSSEPLQRRWMDRAAGWLVVGAANGTTSDGSRRAVVIGLCLIFQRQRAHSIDGTSRIYRRAGSEQRASGQTAIPRVSFFGKGILFCDSFSQRYPSMSSTAGGLGVNGCIVFHRLHYDHGTSHSPPPPTSVTPTPTAAVSVAFYVFNDDLPGTRQCSTAQPQR